MIIINKIGLTGDVSQWPSINIFYFINFCIDWIHIDRDRAKKHNIKPAYYWI